MSVQVKRKRGRPRLDEPREIRDFDNNLIQEFEQHTVFYDRQHPQHRNREYTDRIWHRIGQNLNVSTSLAKTRMLQLRNRFNLEKRRVEAMREQHNSSAVSQWSLYERLSFLGNYVKTRRPYSFANKATSAASTSDDEDNDDLEGVKTQESAFSSERILTNGNLLNNKPNVHEVLSANRNQMPTDSVSPQQVQRNVLKKAVDIKEFGSKYKAFGQFLSSSLIEMSDIQALNLVEKFTVDLVKSLKEKETKRSFIDVSQRSNTDAEDDNSLVC